MVLSKIPKSGSVISVSNYNTLSKESKDPCDNNVTPLGTFINFATLVKPNVSV